MIGKASGLLDLHTLSDFRLVAEQKPTLNALNTSISEGLIAGLSKGNQWFNKPWYNIRAYFWERVC